MDIELLLQINGWLSVGMFLITVLAIMNPLVKDGIIVKSGLILMCLGYFGCASGLVEGMTYGLVFSSWILTNIGLLVALSGWLVRGYFGNHAYHGPRRRRADILRSQIQELA